MKSFLLAATIAAVAAPALASGVWTATPAQASSKTSFVAGSVIWACSGSTCRTTSDTTGADSLSACRDLASQLGPITAFAIDGHAYSTQRLASCNVSAKH